MSEQTSPPVAPPSDAPATQPPAGVPLKQVAVTVPDSIPFDMVQMGTQLGLQMIGLVQSGRAVIAYPKFDQRPDGTKTMGLSQFAVLLLDEADAPRLLKLGEAITAANQAIIKARQSGNQADSLTAEVQGKKFKDNAGSVAEGGVSGTGGIIKP